MVIPRARPPVLLLAWAAVLHAVLAAGAERTLNPGSSVPRTRRGLREDVEMAEEGSVAPLVAFLKFHVSLRCAAWRGGFAADWTRAEEARSWQGRGTSLGTSYLVAVVGGSVTNGLLSAAPNSAESSRSHRRHRVSKRLSCACMP